MFTKKQKIIVSKYDPSNYINGFDIHDSLLLSLINEPTLEKIRYEITVHEYRPDLIATDIYGSSSYIGLLLLQVKKPLEEYKRGTILEVLPKTSLDLIIGRI